MPFAGSEGLEDDEDPICLEKKIMQRGAFSHRRFHAEIGSNLNPKQSTNLRIFRRFLASQQKKQSDRELSGAAISAAQEMRTPKFIAHRTGHTIPGGYRKMGRSVWRRWGDLLLALFLCSYAAEAGHSEQ